MKNRKDLRKKYVSNINNPNKKKNKKKVNDISTPERAKGGRAYRFYIRNNETLKRYIDILKIRYCEDLVQFYNIFWNVTTDSTGNITIQTQVKVREKKRTNISNIDVDTQPKDLQTLYVVTIIHANLTVLVHGKSRDKWIEHEYPLLKGVYKYSLQDRTSTLFECYCFILGINIFQHQLPLQEVNIKDELIQDDNEEESEANIEKAEEEKIIEMLAQQNNINKAIEQGCAIELPSLPSPLPTPKRSKKKENTQNIVCNEGDEKVLVKNVEESINSIRRRQSNESINAKNKRAEKRDRIENKENNKKVSVENVRNTNSETITSIENAVKDMDTELRYWISSYKADRATQEQELKTVMEHVVTLLIKGTRKLRCKVDRLTESVKKQNAEIHELKEQNQKKINHHKNEFQNAIKYLIEEINDLKKEIRKKSTGDNQGITEITNVYDGDNDKIREIQESHNREMVCNKLELLQKHNEILDNSRGRNSRQTIEDEDNDEATNLLALLHSNSKCTPFYKLFPDKTFNIIPCKSIRAAKNILAVSRQNDVTTQTHDILLDIGTDDLERHHPERVALDLCQVAEDFKDLFQCKTYVSALSTEQADLKDLVEHANAFIQQILVNKGDGNIVLLNHDETDNTGDNDDYGEYEIEEINEEEETEGEDIDGVEDENEVDNDDSEDNDYEEIEGTEENENHEGTDENENTESRDVYNDIENDSKDSSEDDNVDSEPEEETEEGKSEQLTEVNKESDEEEEDNETVDLEEFNDCSSGTDMSFTDFYVKSITTMSNGMAQLANRLSATTTKTYQRLKMADGKIVAENVDRKGSTESVERKRSAEIVEMKRSAENVDRKSSAENVERERSVENFERKRSAENAERNGSAENKEQKRLAEKIERKGSAEREDRRSVEKRERRKSSRIRPVEYVERAKPAEDVEPQPENHRRIRPAEYIESVITAGQIERIRAENIDRNQNGVHQDMNYFENNTISNTKGIKAFSYEIWKQEQNSAMDNFTSTYV